MFLPEGGSPTYYESSTRSVSAYAIGNYAYDNRYLLDLSWRKDGSSVFGVNTHFTDTWSAGLGWNIHNEAFMKDQDFINYFKIRASIGNPGNQNFNDYISVKIFSYDTGYPTPWGSSILIHRQLGLEVLGEGLRVVIVVFIHPLEHILGLGFLALGHRVAVDPLKHKLPKLVQCLLHRLRQGDLPCLPALAQLFRLFLDRRLHRDPGSVWYRS